MDLRSSTTRGGGEVDTTKVEVVKDGGFVFLGRGRRAKVNRGDSKARGHTDGIIDDDRVDAVGRSEAGNRNKAGGREAQKANGGVEEFEFGSRRAGVGFPFVKGRGEDGGFQIGSLPPCGKFHA
jgi:hypothetical protein